MNRRQVIATLATFASAYPSAPELSDGTIALWVEEMTNVDSGAAEKACRRIVREDTRFPSIARFLEMARACTPSVLALPSPGSELTKEEQLANVAKLREVMANVVKRA